MLKGEYRMLFKENYKEAICRLGNLYLGKNLNGICAKMEIPNKYIEQYKKENTNGDSEYPNIEKRAEFWENVLSIYSELDDDSLPNCYMSELDEGLYAGLVNAETRFLNDVSTGWISSMAVPFIKDLKDTYNFVLDEDNLWFKRYINQLHVYTQRAKGKFGISHFILVNGLNFLFELRGATNTYYDVLENSKEVQKLMDFSFDLNLWVQNIFFKTVGLYDGGTCSNMAQWIPGRIISESLDPFHMTSVDMFEEWGKGQIQKIFDCFDGGVIHLHSNGHHLLESAARLKGLKCIYLLDEQFTDPIYTKMDKLVDKRNNIPLVINIPFEVFTEKLLKKELPSNIFYIVTGVSDVKNANLVMKDVKSYRV